MSGATSKAAFRCGVCAVSMRRVARATKRKGTTTVDGKTNARGGAPLCPDQARHRVRCVAPSALCDAVGRTLR